MDWKKLPKITPLMTGAAIVIAQAVILAIAFASSAEVDSRKVWLVPAVALLSGLLTGFFHQKGWIALLVVYIFGLVIGDISALSIINQPVEGVFFIVTATVAFFTALGLSVGILAELVRLIHYLAHGGRIWKYPGERLETKDER